MTPTSTSYTIPANLTGYTSNQTINPSELNIWRVIRKNEDGTVEAVSEYVSSTQIYFSREAGYINYIKTLNIIATQYTNDKYVSSTRHIGYSNQTETITDTSKLDQKTPPWTINTSDQNQWTGCNVSSFLCGTDEELGAGDIGYETDYNLVNNVYKTMLATTPNGVAAPYWLASRYYEYYLSHSWGFFGRFVTASGSFYYENWRIFNYWHNVQDNGVTKFSVRPIITLKSDIQITSSDGKSVEKAYRFE